MVQAEYGKLQALYEDLKAAKIDEEVALLLEQQNKHVTEHGHKAAQLAEHYKAEVGGGQRWGHGAGGRGQSEAAGELLAPVLLVHVHGRPGSPM